MVSPKQWGLVVKGIKAVRKARQTRKVIHMIPSAEGGFVKAAQQSGVVGDLAHLAFSKARSKTKTIRDMTYIPTKKEFVAGLKTRTGIRTIGMMGGGSALGVEATRAEQRHMDKRRAAVGKGPVSRGAKIAGVAGGAIGGALLGMKVSKHIGKIDRISRPTILGLTKANPDAIARTATSLLGAAAGGITAQENITHHKEKTGYYHKGAKAARITAGILGGAAGGALTYSVARRVGGMARLQFPEAMAGRSEALTRLGVIGAASGLMGAQAVKIHRSDGKTPKKTIGTKVRKAVLAAHGAMIGTGLSELAFLADSQWGHKVTGTSGAAGHEQPIDPNLPIFKRARSMWGKLKSKAFRPRPVKPIALLGPGSGAKPWVAKDRR